MTSNGESRQQPSDRAAIDAPHSTAAVEAEQSSAPTKPTTASSPWTRPDDATIQRNRQQRARNRWLMALRTAGTVAVAVAVGALAVAVEARWSDDSRSQRPVPVDETGYRPLDIGLPPPNAELIADSAAMTRRDSWAAPDLYSEFDVTDGMPYIRNAVVLSLRLETTTIQDDDDIDERRTLEDTDVDMLLPYRIDNPIATLNSLMDQYIPVDDRDDYQIEPPHIGDTKSWPDGYWVLSATRAKHVSGPTTYLRFSIIGDPDDTIVSLSRWYIHATDQRPSPTPILDDLGPLADTVRAAPTIYTALDIGTSSSQRHTPGWEPDSTYRIVLAEDDTLLRNWQTQGQALCDGSNTTIAYYDPTDRDVPLNAICNTADIEDDYPAPYDRDLTGEHIQIAGRLDG